MDFDRTEYILAPCGLEQELKILFPRKKSLTIFEIGACEGEDSVKYSRLFPEAKIYAFEPLPANIPLIQHNFLKYGVRNASYFNKALSNKEGQAEFYVSSGRPDEALESDWDYGNKSSSLLQPEKHLETAPFIQFKDKIVVETITLKSFCIANNIKAIDFVHMDVQGAELMVLEGAGDFISSIKVIWLEVSKVNFYKNQPLVADVKKFMSENNFVLIKDAAHGIQGDQLYVSKNYYSNLKIFLIGKQLYLESLLTRALRKPGFK
ncbi:FkbM family methyltransferase [Segetibacter aerophilus]|uniref:2-O-methyltransferase NoeI n=1 Tax=Segetibacter aerophilus TaxID=670293 RepID=A0A512B6N0_9BACT|nr:FkbM family methyltransferase [Segetibacter aerophilus]GEO07620.1 2-O-methyltransferase NoeI [Segetibacter aerophilus]